MSNKLGRMAIIGTAFLAAGAFAQPSGGPPSYARNQGGQGQPGMPNGNQAPGGPGGMARHGPPPEAVSACAGKNGNAPCSFVTPRGNTLDGLCRQVPEGKFACVPKYMGGPGGPQGGNHRQPGGAGGGMPPGGQ